MAFELEVDYYNSYVLRRLVTNRDTAQGGTDFSSSNRAIYRTWPSVEGSNYERDGYPFWAPNPVAVPAPYIQYPISNVAKDASQWVIGTTDPNWIVEEARIRGGFNNTITDLGVRAYLVEENPQPNNRFNSIIYSGVYNSRTSYNETNVFSVAEDITKSLDPHYGGIQRMYAENTNLTVFQENKVSSVLIDKDAIYSAEGSAAVTSTPLVLGQTTPYTGEYGISKNPESFDVFGFRKYFADKYRKSICRLSKDGITEISNYGMNDFFRDELANVKDDPYLYTVDFLDPGGLSQNPSWPYPSPLPPFATQIYITLTTYTQEQFDLIEPGMCLYLRQNGNLIDCQSYVASVDFSTNRVYLVGLPSQNLTVTGSPSDGVVFASYKKDRIIGVYDTYKDNYILSFVKYSTSPTSDDSYHTLAYDEMSQGWVSFYSYYPYNTRSLRNNLYSTKGNNLYIHYDANAYRNSYYDAAPVSSSITFIFNANPSVNKNFKTVGYEGTNGWQVESFISDNEEFVGGQTFNDEVKTVYSYDEGLYTEGGVNYRLGFNLRENKYHANLRNKYDRSGYLSNSTRPGQVVISENGENVSGIKGFFATVKISTDTTTDIYGLKELFAVSSDYAISSY